MRELSHSVCPRLAAVVGYPCTLGALGSFIPTRLIHHHHHFHLHSSRKIHRHSTKEAWTPPVDASICPPVHRDSVFFRLAAGLRHGRCPWRTVLRNGRQAMEY
ncbi:hypothetical protein BDW62DRAFT_158936 [Aspergillus aurantiobrunneus]